GATAFHFMGIFSPGAFDHHNMQLTLVLAMAAWLVIGRSFQSGLAAGAAAAVSLAVGMETMPYVAAAGATVALLFWLHGDRGTSLSAGVAMGLSAAAAFCLATTVRPGAWFATTCDAFSGGQAGSAMLAGLGMAAIAVLAGERGRAARLA